jgi:hypothetical protein
MKKPPVNRNTKLNLKEIMERQLKSQFQWHGTFWSVFGAFRETDHGTIRALQIDRSGKGSTSLFNVKASRSDFIADVETAARSVLSRVEYRRFEQMKNMREVPVDIPHLSIMEKCGAEFFRRGIYPLSEYFRGVYCIPDRRKS